MFYLLDPPNAIPALPDMLLKHGRESASFQILNRGVQRVRFRNPDAMVGYGQSRSRIVTAGAPVCDPADMPAAVLRMRDFAAAHNRGLVFFNIEEEAAALLRTHPKTCADTFVTKIGEQPVIDPCEWRGFQRKEAKNLHAQLGRAARHGLQCREVEGARVLTEYRDQILNVMHLWQFGHSLPPLGFTATDDGLSWVEERRYFGVFRGESLVALLVCSPVYGRKGWLLETVYRRPRAPQGAAELAIYTALAVFRDLGVRYVSFGLTALAGVDASAESFRQKPLALTLRITQLLGGRFYSFHGIRAFRQKFVPTRWENSYMAAMPFSRRIPGIPAVLALYSIFSKIQGTLVPFPFRLIRHRIIRLFASPRNQRPAPRYSHRMQ